MLAPVCLRALSVNASSINRTGGGPAHRITAFDGLFVADRRLDFQWVSVSSEPLELALFLRQMLVDFFQ